MSRTHAARIAVALAIALFANAHAHAREQSASSGDAGAAASGSAQGRAVILAVNMNGLPADPGTVFLESDAGRLHAPASFMDLWKLRHGAPAFVPVEGEPYFDLSATPGLSWRWDRASSELFISATEAAFHTTRINVGAGPGRSIEPYHPGGYLNYDVSSTHGLGIGSTQALLDVALFRGEGLLTSSVKGGTGGGARLMTTWQTDRVAAIKTLRIGDSYNTTGAWGRGVLFGGFQYGTNFAVRPDFVTVAMPTLSGRALLPSTVDVYINHALRSRQQVNAGPFSIQNLPLVTGAGEIEMVVKDVLGREQLITQSFFASPNLLRVGLVDEAYEFGWIRANYGLVSNDYAEAFGAATYRKGLTERLTGEARIETQKAVTALGFTAAMRLPERDSVVEATVAFSTARGLAPGVLGRAVYSYLGERWSANARLQLNSRTFRQVGSDPDNLLSQSGSAQFSTHFAGGSLSVNYLRNLNQGQSLVRLVNMNYSRRLNDTMFANVTLLKPLAGGAGVTAALSVTILFDRSHVGSATLSGGAGAAALYTELQKSAPSGEGTGYRLAQMSGGFSPRQEATLVRNQSYGSFQGDLVRLNGETSTRVGARGGVAVLGGDAYFSRGLEQGFAVVQAADLPAVPVYQENQLVGHTDRSGRMIVTNLRAYQENRIAIEPVTLPMDVTIGEFVRTVVPRRQGGVLVNFSVRRVRTATLRIVQADGSPLPAWTPVEVVGAQEAFTAGLRGEVSVELPALKGNRIIARPEGGPACVVIVDQPEAGVTAPFIGPLQCGREQ